MQTLTICQGAFPRNIDGCSVEMSSKVSIACVQFCKCNHVSDFTLTVIRLLTVPPFPDLQMVINVQSNYVPKRVVVGAPAGDYKYPWNPMVDFSKWGADNPVYVGDSLGECFGSIADESPSTDIGLVAWSATISY